MKTWAGTSRANTPKGRGALFFRGTTRIVRAGGEILPLSFTPFDPAMPRQPQLRKKTVGGSVYWFTKAGGETYFGRVDEVSHKNAKKLFADHLVKVRTDEGDRKRGGLTAGELMDTYLDWFEKRRDSYSTRKSYLTRFGKFVVAGRQTKLADIAADKVRGSDLEAWLTHLEKDDLGAQTRLHAETAVRACWNWATKHPSPTPYLPPAFRPFSAVERTHVPLEPLLEADLMTDAEIKALLKAAEYDPDQFRRHGLKKTVEKRGVDGLRRIEGSDGNVADLLKCYYATGARTAELLNCRVSDLLPVTKQLVLGRHKRERTMSKKVVRQVTLNEEAFGIVIRHCEGKQPADHIFANGRGTPWTVRKVAQRVERAREVAKAVGLGTVRNEITVYDFRHLWISEALMTQMDVTMVARMAGTSISMIERVYGHFRTDHLQQAQEQLDRARRERRGG